MPTIVKVIQPGHYSLGLRTRVTPGANAPAGEYVFPTDIRTEFANSIDQRLIAQGVLQVSYVDELPKPVVASPVPAPVQTPAAAPVPVVAPAPVDEPEVEEPVVIENIEAPAVVKVTAPKRK